MPMLSLLAGGFMCAMPVLQERSSRSVCPTHRRAHAHAQRSAQRWCDLRFDALSGPSCQILR